MRTKVTIAKTSPLPTDAIDTLTGELFHRIQHHFPDDESNVTVRYAGADNLSVIGAIKEGKECISEILQEAWESADDQFTNEQIMICSDVCSPGRPGFFIHTIL